MTPPSDLVAIPPKVRTVIYYVLAVALAVVSPLVGYGRLDSLWLVILSGIGGVFFAVAGSNVSRKAAPVEVPAEFTPEQTGYMGGV